MRFAVLLLLSAAAIAEEPYRPGPRDGSERVTGRLSEVHPAEGLIPTSGGATERVEGLRGALAIDAVRPPLHVFRPSAGWVRQVDLALEPGKKVDLAWIGANAPQVQTALAEGAFVAGTIYHESAGLVLAVDSARAKPPDAEDRFDEPVDAVEALIAALQRKDARGVRRRLVGGALAAIDAALESAPNDEQGLQKLADMLPDGHVVRDELRIEGRPDESWLRIRPSDPRLPAHVYHLARLTDGWRIDNLNAADIGPAWTPTDAGQGKVPPAGEAAIAVQASLPTETLLEGERAVAKIRIQNTGKAPVLLLSIDAEDGVETLGASFVKAVPDVDVTVEAGGGSIEVRPFPPGAARLPRAPRDVGRLAPLAPGQETSREVVFKAPTGHLYAVHFAVRHATVEQAVAAGAVYVPHGTMEDQGGKVEILHRARAGEPVPPEALLDAADFAGAPRVHAAVAVEVRPRDFSFAKAAKKAGFVPEASTWLEARGFWALSANGKTLLLGPDKRVTLRRNYVPLLSAVELEGKDVIALHAPGEDDFARRLDEEGYDHERGKDGLPTFRVPTKTLPEVLLAADELGFEVVPGGWRRSE